MHISHVITGVFHSRFREHVTAVLCACKNVDHPTELVPFTEGLQFNVVQIKSICITIKGICSEINGTQG